MPYVIEFNLIFKDQKTFAKESAVFSHPPPRNTFARSINNGRACCAEKNRRSVFMVRRTMRKSEHAPFLAKVYRDSKNF